MALSAAEKERLKAEIARQSARDAESDDQKWLRSAIRDEMRDLMTELFGGDDEDEPAEGEGRPPKQSGGSVFDIGSLFGGGNRKTG